MKVYILGFPGSGKSTIAKRLASYLKCEFADTDKLIEQNTGMSVSEYFARYGQNAFREIEQQVLQRTADMQHTIVAVGGGTPCYYHNMEFMNSHGVTVYLQMNDKALYSRLKNHTSYRPLMAEEAHLQQYITSTLQEREPYYMQARIHVSGLSVNISLLADAIRQVEE